MDMVEVSRQKNYAGCSCVNFGAGQPLSVIDLLNTFKKVIGESHKKVFLQLRSGDLPCYYASVEWAIIKLDWGASRSIEVACRGVWKLQRDDNI